MRQTLRNPTQRGFVVWGWQGAVSICLVFTGSLSQPRLKMLRDVNVGRYQGLFRPRGWPPGQGWGGGEVWRWSWLNTLHVGVGRPVPTTSVHDNGAPPISGAFSQSEWLAAYALAPGPRSPGLQLDSALQVSNRPPSCPWGVCAITNTFLGSVAPKPPSIPEERDSAGEPRSWHFL